MRAAAGGGLGALAAATCARGGIHASIDRWLDRQALPPGRLLGPTVRRGHFARDYAAAARHPAEPAGTHAVVIVGGGVAGLSAAWQLRRLGVKDIVLLELEDALGGTARGGVNAVTAFPWGAHYLPLPGREAQDLHDLLRSLGVITGSDAVGHPVYDEGYLCSDPQERLFQFGRWQDGIVPRHGLRPEEAAQFASFFAHLDALRRALGNDGRPAFAIPTAASSQDERYLALDRLTMASYLDKYGWNAPALRWYVNYCLRDDFGCRLETASAWAGLHYFAARRPLAANAAAGSVLTWPEGNFWLVERLRQDSGAQIRTGAVALSLDALPDGDAAVNYLDTASGKVLRLRAGAVIAAVPQTMAARLVRPPLLLPNEKATATATAAASYAPWMVANATVEGLTGPGHAPLAWDNVSYHGESLGYVVATHQEQRLVPNTTTVLTLYYPLTAETPEVERLNAAARSHADWSRLVLRELAPMHPGIAAQLRWLDVWVWPHAMIRPTPGLRQSLSAATGKIGTGPVFVAHTDRGGMALFEEAHHFGVQAARGAAQWLGRRGGRELSHAG